MKKLMYVFIMIALMMIPMVTCFQFDNIKGDMIKDNSEYGKVEIRNSFFGFKWFQLGTVMSLELKENTEICLDTGCSARQEIIMYENGKLIDDIRFIDLKTGREVDIWNYNIYVNGDLYNGEEVNGTNSGIKYDVEIKGKLRPFQKVDWQIKSAGTDWIDEWAVWSGSLEVDLWEYHDFEEGTGNYSKNYVDDTNYNFTGLTGNWDTSGALGSAYNTTDDTTNATGQTVGVYLDSTVNFFGNTSGTINFWIKKTGNWYNSNILEKAGVTNGDIELSYQSPNKVEMRGYDGGGLAWGGTPVTITSDDTWYMFTFTHNTSTGKMYLNGVVKDSRDLNNFLTSNKPYTIFGTPTGARNMSNTSIDELGFWNRSLSPTEVSDLWNDGVGISPTGVPITVSLTSPDNDTNLASSVANFECDASIRVRNITNITLYHNDTGIWEVNQTNTTSHSLNSSLTVPVTFQNFNTIRWNCFACDNSTTTICDWGINRTFTLLPFSINSETYNLNTTEGNLETFIIDISSAELYVRTATLNYNNTYYPGTLVRDGYDYIVSAEINIDNVIDDSNLTFNWTFVMEDDTIYNSDSHNQSVSALSLGECGGVNNVTILNYTLYDEDNLTKLDGAGFNTNIELSVRIYTKGTLNEILNYSDTFNKTNPAEVCLNVNLSNSEYRLDTSTTYTSDDRELEHHYIQNFSLTKDSIHQNISLYNLNSSKSTIFLITYKDTNFLPVENALINIQREYLGEGLFRSVEIGKTDADGQSIGHFIENDVVYTLIITKDGRVLSTFENIVAWCDDVVAKDCRINLNQFDTGIQPHDWSTYQNLNYVLDDNFDDGGRDITLVFTTIDGTSATITLNTTKNDMWANDTVCSDILVSSAGTLTCTIPNSYGNVSVISYVWMDDILITVGQLKIFPDNYFGGTGIIFILILVIILPLMFITSTVGVVIGSLLGIIIAGGLMLYQGSWLGVGSAFIWILCAGLIIIWKISARSKN